jgi:uncharacterized membrane protein (UPF0182 family)
MGWKRSMVLISIGLAALAISFLTISLIFVDFIVDLWWYQSLNYGAYFWLRLLYRYVIFVAVAGFFFLIFFLNFWVASHFLGTTEAVESKTGAPVRHAYQEVVRLFRSGSVKLYVPLSVVLGILVALPLFQQWEAALLYIFGSRAGAIDPIFGKDISYYLFSFPIYSLLQDRLLLAFGLLFIALIVLYWTERRLLFQYDQRLPRGAKIHLSILILLIFAIEIWDYILQRYELLYSTNNQPLFFGPGYVEMQVVLPLIWITLLFLMGTACSLVFYINTKRGLKAAVLFAAFFLLALGVRESAFLPGMVEQFLVKPAELTRQSKHIMNSVQATKAAYNLEHAEIREYDLLPIPQIDQDPRIEESIRNIPVWYEGVLLEVYEQMQAIRPYYEFTGIDVDRYTVNGVYQQVFISARDLILGKLPAGAQNWINTHLKYTHGYGVAMNPAAQGGEEAMTWFIGDLPPTSAYGLTIKQPGIYYGLEPYDYVIAPNDNHEFDYPKGDTFVMTDYNGTGGVPISSLFNKFMFAVYFKEKNIFLTPETNKRSRILFRRNIIEAINTLTPYLMLDRDPYVVVTSERIYWIQDAYTTSDWYPNAQTYSDVFGEFNYIRNSTKIVVDAYDGTISYYIADPKDPLITAYSRIYPGLLKSMDELNEDLKSHIRYPKDLFEIQMSIYAKYHQSDPDMFYKQEDIWEFAREFKRETELEVKPYYLTLDLIEKGREEFILLAPMRPKGLDNLRAMAVAGCDGDNYGKIIIYSFPKGVVVYGPSQIEAIIDQDPFVAQQLTLWNQIGTEVQRGKLIILPFGGTVEYILPIYLKAASGVKIPQLTRLIVTQGDVVVMEPTLEEALEKMTNRLRERLFRSEPPTGQPSRPLFESEESAPQVTDQ